MKFTAPRAPYLGEFLRSNNQILLPPGQSDIWSVRGHVSLFEVKWSTKVEADSVPEAAFLAYKAQKAQSTSHASYTVQSDSDVFEDVTIAKVAPLELLTIREDAVARLVMLGASNSDIGKELGITPRTVKSHVSHIFGKFHVSSRVTLATKLLRMTRSDQTDASL